MKIIYRDTNCCSCNKKIKKTLTNSTEFKPQICLRCFIYENKWFRFCILVIMLISLVNFVFGFFEASKQIQNIQLIINIIVFSLCILYLLFDLIISIISRKKSLNKFK